MFTINIKGKGNPKDPKMVKLEIIFFKTDHARVTKILNISGPLKEWDNQSQSFNANHSNAIAKNKMLFEMKNEYQKVAEEWDYEKRMWSPVELSHYFDQAKVCQTEVQSNTVLRMIDSLIDRFSNKERCKNGIIIKCVGNARSYKDIKTSLIRFTPLQYGKAFSTFFFKDITEKFLLDYALHIQKQGIENGNKGSLPNRLRKLRAVCSHAEKMNIYGVNLEAFECLGDKIRYGHTTSKAVSYKVIEKLETIDRSLLSIGADLCLDLFLFSYYSGGMANVDVCHLTWDSIKENQIIYERIKCTKVARPLLIDPARKIIEKYRGTGFENYVFPVFTVKHKTDLQKMYRVTHFSEKVTYTLKEACRILKIDEKITWYSARGSFITRMVDEGYSSYIVAEMAGNSPEVINKHYYKK